MNTHDAIQNFIERAIEIGQQRERNRLRLFVRSIPTYDDDGLWVKTQILTFLNEVTTPEASGNGLATPLVGSQTLPDASAAATALKEREVAPEQSGIGRV